LNTKIPLRAAPANVRVKSGAALDGRRWPVARVVALGVASILAIVLLFHSRSLWGAADPSPVDQHIPLGELALEVEADPWRLRLLDPAGRAVWEEAADQTLGFHTSDGERPRATRLLRATSLGAGAVQLLAATDDPAGRVLAVEAHSLAPRLLRLTVAPSMPQGVQSVGGAILAGGDERFVGFGERFGAVNQRGRLVDVWADDRALAGQGDSTYAPLPLLFSSRGHGFTLERFDRARFDLAASRPDRWTWEQEAASASILVSYGPSLKELLQRHVEATGRSPLPPIWAFGVWKTAIGGQEHVLGEARRLRELGVPVSALFVYDAIDFPANIGWPHVNFAGRSAGPYPDHGAFTASLHGLGFKATTYFTADFPLDRPSYAEPARLGFLVKRADGEPYVHPRFPTAWLDFTNSSAVDWWGRLWRRALVELGYDGGMLDLGEILPADAHFADGTRGAATHNRYPLLFAQSAWQHASRLRPEGDFVLFARSGAVGGQRFQSLQWPGDALMRWEAPDGLRAMIPAALSFGLSGFPYWHAEVAGYIQAGLSPAEERELWLRWLQLATWTSALRDHYGDHPTSPIDFWLDEGTITAYRDAARLHNSLVPYLYTYAAEASRTGLPLMRYLALEAPDDARAWQEEQSYFLGPLLLVAPVVERGATVRTVYLPPGDWVDFWTDQLYRGGQEITVPAPLDGGRAPVFLRAGAVLPLAAEFDSLAPSALGGVRTYGGDLDVRIAPGGAGPSEFTLYDGTRLLWDGAATLRVVANARPRTIQLRLPNGSQAVRHIEGAEDQIRAP
jgi:alpha-D-xyloside xylohydrolase